MKIGGCMFVVPFGGYCKGRIPHIIDQAIIAGFMILLRV